MTTASLSHRLNGGSSMLTVSGKAMRNSGWIDTQLWVREWRRLHPHKATAVVADRLGAPVRTVEKWFSGESKPSLTWAGAIMAEYGAAFVVAGMPRPPRWLCEAANAEKRQALMRERAAIDAEFSDLEYEGLDA